MSSFYCFWFFYSCFVGIFFLAIGVLFSWPWWLFILLICLLVLPLVVLVIVKCALNVNVTCIKDDGNDEDDVNHHSMNALNRPRAFVQQHACRPDACVSLSLTPQEPGRRGVINIRVSNSVYSNPSADEHNQLHIVKDLKEYVLPTYENAKRYKTLSNPDGDPPPSYEVAILHM